MFGCLQLWSVTDWMTFTIQKTFEYWAHWHSFAVCCSDKEGSTSHSWIWMCHIIYPIDTEDAYHLNFTYDNYFGGANSELNVHLFFWLLLLSFEFECYLMICTLWSYYAFCSPFNWDFTEARSVLGCFEEC